MIINGNIIAQEIRDELKQLKGAGLPRLDIFIVGKNPVIENFVTRKRRFAEYLGVHFTEHRFDESITTDELIQMVQGTPGPHGVVVQLPLPVHIDTDRVLASVPPEADIDGLAPDSPYTPPVAGAVREVLERTGSSVANSSALVIGKGRLVGEPVAQLLRALGAHVTVVDKSTAHAELITLTQQADIIVSGAGVPNLITPDMLRRGVVLIDAGTSTQAGVVVGDIAHECVSLASVFARTPGGIGPITIAILFKNLIYGTMPRPTLG